MQLEWLACWILPSRFKHNYLRIVIVVYLNFFIIDNCQCHTYKHIYLFDSEVLIWARRDNSIGLSNTSAPHLYMSDKGRSGRTESESVDELMIDRQPDNKNRSQDTVKWGSVIILLKIIWYVWKREVFTWVGPLLQFILFSKEHLWELQTLRSYRKKKETYEEVVPFTLSFSRNTGLDQSIFCSFESDVIFLTLWWLAAKAKFIGNPWI